MPIIILPTTLNCSKNRIQISARGPGKERSHLLSTILPAEHNITFGESEFGAVVIAVNMHLQRHPEDIVFIAPRQRGNELMVNHASFPFTPTPVTT